MTLHVHIYTPTPTHMHIDTHTYITHIMHVMHICSLMFLYNAYTAHGVHTLHAIDVRVVSEQCKLWGFMCCLLFIFCQGRGIVWFVYKVYTFMGDTFLIFRNASSFYFEYFTSKYQGKLHSQVIINFIGVIVMIIMIAILGGGKSRTFDPACCQPSEVSSHRRRSKGRRRWRGENEEQDDKGGLSPTPLIIHTYTGGNPGLHRPVWAV